METPRKFIIAKVSIRKFGSSPVLIISTDENPSLRIESFAITNLSYVSTNYILYIYVVLTHSIIRTNLT